MKNSRTDGNPAPQDDLVSTTGSTNPYQSSGQVGDGASSGNTPSIRHGSGLLWMLFSFEERTPRRVFWGASIIATMAFSTTVFVLILLMGEAVIESVVIVALNVPLLWSYLAIATKRWHDRNKSGAWILIAFIPFIGPFWLLFEIGCRRGTIGDNRYGPDPT